MNGPDARSRAIDRIRQVVLGEQPTLTREEMTAAAGLTVEQARPFWRAMGFADVGEARAFTPRDLECLMLVAGWVLAGQLDEATALELVRAIGQTTARLADWQVGTMTRVLIERGQHPDLEAVGTGLADVLPGFETLLAHTWRRHLAAVIGRGLDSVDAAVDGLEGIVGSVGFADIAGFTRLARGMADEDLAGMVHAFETGAADIVAAHGGRLVKTLGDEVMFIALDVEQAVAIAVDMHGLTAPGPEVLNLRIGLATGRIIMRMGDVYGDTVNVASRLTAVARPGSTLIDWATVEGLPPDGPFKVRHLPPRPLRGLGIVRSAAVSRRR